MHETILTIAHRFGNNVKSLKKAIESSVDAIECDIWLTKNLDFAVRHGKRRSPYTPKLLLEKVLRKTSGTKRLVLDIKGEYDERARRKLAFLLLDLLREMASANYYIIDAEDIGLLRQIDKMARALKLPAHELRLSIRSQEHLDNFLSLNESSTNFLFGVTISRKILTGQDAAKLRKRNMQVSVYAVNNMRAALRFIKMGATGICSDNLELLEKLKGLKDEANNNC